jgi:hypothetical protein
MYLFCAFHVRMSSEQHSVASAEAPETSQTAPNGESAPTAEAAREARRARRLVALEQARDANVQTVVRLGQYIAGELDEKAAVVFDRVADPCLALARLTRLVQQIVTLEDRIDQDDETRALALKQEAEARETAARQAEAWRAGAPDRQAREEAEEEQAAKKHAIRRAVRNAHKENWPDTDADTREAQLDAMFSDYEAYDDYEGDPEEIVTQLCAELGLSPVESMSEESQAQIERERQGIRSGAAPFPGMSPEAAEEFRRTPARSGRGPP